MRSAKNFQKNQSIVKCSGPDEKFFFKNFILSFLHLLPCVYIIWATPLPIPGRSYSTLSFSDFVEEKT
jgi:hypothetical protein